MAALPTAIGSATPSPVTTTSGGLYQTTVIGVDPGSGAENSGSLVSNTWYDPAGNAIETQDGGTQEFTKTVYNGLDEPTAVYVGFDPSGDPSTFATAGSVSGDIILEQTNTQYDNAGDATFVTTFDRYDDAPTSDTGALDGLGRRRLPGLLRGLLVRWNRPRDRGARFWGDGHRALSERRQPARD